MVAVSQQTTQPRAAQDRLSQALGPPPAIVPEPPALSQRILKKLSHAPGRDRAARKGRADPSAIELWFADESRVGQKNKITRRWAKRGSRPSAPSDQRTASALHFRCDLSEGRQRRRVASSCRVATPGRLSLHLAEIATQIAPSAHAAILVDQAGLASLRRVERPSNITLIALPAKCPELNPKKHIWQFMRENWLSEPDLRAILRRHRRSLLTCLEQAHRSALADHVHQETPANGPTGSNQRVLV